MSGRNVHPHRHAPPPHSTDLLTLNGSALAVHLWVPGAGANPMLHNAKAGEARGPRSPVTVGPPPSFRPLPFSPSASTEQYAFASPVPVAVAVPPGGATVAGLAARDFDADGRLDLLLTVKVPAPSLPPSLRSP